MITLLSGLILNGTFSAEYSVGDLTIGFEYQYQQEVQETIQKNEKSKVAELSRKANNQL